MFQASHPGLLFLAPSPIPKPSQSPTKSPLIGTKDTPITQNYKHFRSSVPGTRGGDQFTYIVSLHRAHLGFPNSNLAFLFFLNSLILCSDIFYILPVCVCVCVCVLDMLDNLQNDRCIGRQFWLGSKTMFLSSKPTLVWEKV